MTAKRLFKYADGFARRAEAAGKGTQYPTFRQVGKRFGVGYDAIEAAVEAHEGPGYLGIGVALRGGGSVIVLKRSDRVVEAYK